MIDIQKDTPIEYSKQSRDYQVFAFLFTILFNYSKMYTDLIANIWTDHIDDRLLDLRSYTLNFIPKFQWESDDLRGVTNCFRFLLRSKGTVGAIRSCLEILARVRGIELNGLDVTVEDGIVVFTINEEIADVGNIEDMLRYILPAGCLYEIVKYSRLDSSTSTDIVVDTQSSEGQYLPKEIGRYNSNQLVLPPKDEDGDGKQDYAIPLQNIDFSTGMIVTDGDE